MKPIHERFQRNKRFDAQFDDVRPPVRWYPYVGQNFETGTKRVMVFAHNIPVKPSDYETKIQEWKAKDAWADANTIGEYTYCRGRWTKAFQSFVKGAVGLRENYVRESYDEYSDPQVMDRVDAFISRISYLNFIQDLVRGETQMAKPEASQVEISKDINKEILRILEVTHCICWGADVYHYLVTTSGHKVLEQKSTPLRGFATATIESSGRIVGLLKVHHPSMPEFRPYTPETQTLISEFLNESRTT